MKKMRVTIILAKSIFSEIFSLNLQGGGSISFFKAIMTQLLHEN